MSADDVRVEAERIVHRLTTIPLTRVTAEVCDVVRAHCQAIVELHDHEHVLPTPEPGYAGAMVAVVVTDFLAEPAPRIAEAQAILTDLRRALP